MPIGAIQPWPTDTLTDSTPWIVTPVAAATSSARFLASASAVPRAARSAAAAFDPSAFIGVWPVPVTKIEWSGATPGVPTKIGYGYAIAVPDAPPVVPLPFAPIAVGAPDGTEAPTSPTDRVPLLGATTVTLVFGAPRFTVLGDGAALEHAASAVINAAASRIVALRRDG
jgi:hypothetical protein